MTPICLIFFKIVSASTFFLLVSFSLFLDAFPPRPKMPFGQRHVAINIYNICKGYFGSRREEASKNKVKDTTFIFPMTNATILGAFRTHAKKEYV